jgi:hypothetical protein
MINMKEPIFILLISLILIGGCNSASKVRKQIDEANYCETENDCKNIGSKCPFGCHIYVNNDEALRITDLVLSYEPRCTNTCIQCVEVECVNSKCVPVCDT